MALRDGAYLRKTPTAPTTVAKTPPTSRNMALFEGASFMTSETAEPKESLASRPRNTKTNPTMRMERGISFFMIEW